MESIDLIKHAIENCDLATIKKLVSDNPELINQSDPDGMTPLMHAVSSMDRSIEIIEFFIQAGANVNARTNEGYTPLHFSVDVNGPTCRGELPGKIVSMLLNAGADLEAKQHWGWTPLMCAIVEGVLAEVSALLHVGADPNGIFPKYTLPAFLAGRTTLMAAIGDVEKFQLLVDAGADISSKDMHGDTVLYYAIKTLQESESSNFDPSSITDEIFGNADHLARDMLKKAAEKSGIDPSSEQFEKFFEKFQLDQKPIIENQSQEFTQHINNHNFEDNIRKCIAIIKNA